MQIKIDASYDDTFNQMAQDFGYFWGEKPNVRALVEAIATSELKLVKAEQTDSLQYLKLKEMIAKEQPFKLVYADAKGEPFIFTCTYAEITEFEGKPYLNIWFLEDMESDCPQLKNNRCLRIDRILDNFQLYPIDLPWRETGLDFIEVSFELSGDLVFAYSQKNTDRVENLAKKHIRIHRKISNLFWFRRKIIRYAPNLKIIAPNFIADWYESFLKDALAAQLNTNS